MGALTLVLGGQKAGKSRAAQRLASKAAGPVRMITPAVGLDPELEERIARHREDRGADVHVDETFFVTEALLREPSDTVIVDALDTWLLDRMQRVGLLEVGDAPTALGAEGRAGQDRVLADVDALVDACISRSGASILVAGTVGMGMHGPTTMARRYEDLHGLSTQRLGASAERVLLVVAGRAIELRTLDDLIGN
ncbi:MAG: adenosylcobinamide kinase/adenosylcobinamide-phosphate guanylyltransferase [Glaciecola sp.]|jgi:adenosylcobinamide kinase/adenosylcobinamide-phosphate guanylyltransferase